MGTGYTRNDTSNNIADGNIINASDLDGEFDAVEAAFNESTGHSHDGTATEGAPITVLGPVQDFIASATEIKPKTTNTLDIGTVSLQFKDMHLDGTAYLDDIQAVGAVDITGDLDVDNINIDGNTIISTDTNGDINLSPNGTGTVVINTDLDVDNININGNTISSTDTNGNINLVPNGTGEVNLTDSDKLTFGAGSDLQIYHDGSHSYVTDQGDGNLRLRGSNFVQVLDASGNDMIQAEAGGAVDIYHNGSSKLSTTATGVNVTGTVTADGLTVDGGGTNFPITVTSTDQYAGITFVDNTTTSSAVVAVYADGDELGLEAGNAERMRIDSSGNVGIGTSSPAQLLHVNTTSASSARIRVQNSEGYAEIATDGTDGFLTAGGTEILRFESGGNVGIGTSSPGYPLQVDGSSGQLIAALASSGIGYIRVDTSNAGSEAVFWARATNTGYSTLQFGDPDDGDVGWIKYQHSDNSMQFRTNASEAMRIDSSGDVGIGTTSPASLLHLESDTPVVTLRDTSAYSAGTGPYIQFQGLDSGSTNRVFGQIYGLSNGSNSGELAFHTRNSGTTAERLRIDSSGNVGIGTTSPNAKLDVSGSIDLTGSIESDSVYHSWKIGNYFGNVGFVNNSHVGIALLQNTGTSSNGSVAPNQDDGQFLGTDNHIDLGNSVKRWDDVYATNGTIQTSDANEKQQIAALTDAEMTAAKAISQLFRTYKWNEKVEAKGDAARTHVGVVAQDVEAAMTAAGLDAGDYGFFISTTWWEGTKDYPAIEAVEAVLDENGQVVTPAVEGQEAATIPHIYSSAEEASEGAIERNRKGIRYPELLAFIGAATEQRLSNIETRLAALEAN